MSSEAQTTYDKFRDFFRPRAIEVQEPDEESLREELKRLAHDARIFSETQAYEDLREGLNGAIRSCVPEPEKGTDVAGALALKQAGLIFARELLERIVCRKEEKLDG